MRRPALVLVSALSGLALGAALLAAPAAARPHPRPHFTPGAPGIGDPYFPTRRQRRLRRPALRARRPLRPDTDRLPARHATSGHGPRRTCRRFNLDLDGLTVRSVRVNGRRAAWSHVDGELTVTPSRGLRKRSTSRPRSRTGACPRPWRIGPPDSSTPTTARSSSVSRTSLPPGTRSTTTRATRPRTRSASPCRRASRRSRTASSRGHRTHKGWTTWAWEAREPMASYLTTATMGEFALKAYRDDGIRMVDAIDPRPVRAGRRSAHRRPVRDLAGRARSSYKRLSRTIEVPAGGGELALLGGSRHGDGLGLRLRRGPHAGSATTGRRCPTLNGHTSTSTGDACPVWLSLHPFLEHYQTVQPTATCAPNGYDRDVERGDGHEDGYEQWRVDLGALRRRVGRGLDHVRERRRLPGDRRVRRRRHRSPTGVGQHVVRGRRRTPSTGGPSTGAPAGQRANPNDWIAGTPADGPPTLGEMARGDASRGSREILDFLQDSFGPYPFSASGGIVDDAPRARLRAREPDAPDLRAGLLRRFGRDRRGGRSCTSSRTSGTATASPSSGGGTSGSTRASPRTPSGCGASKRVATAQEIFDSTTPPIPADDPFWDVVIGDPGPDDLFAGAVYDRGAMTLHQLRAHGRRRRLLRDPARVGRPATREAT